MKTVRRILGWKLAPTAEGRLVVFGHLSDGTEWKTSPICEVTGEIVRTDSGSVYKLLPEAIEPGAWIVSLKEKNPAAYRMFRNSGVLQ